MVAPLRPRSNGATEYEELLARHGTREQAASSSPGEAQYIDEARQPGTSSSAAIASRCSARCPARVAAGAASGGTTSTASCSSPRTSIVVLGQDGLVANVAKYLDGQPVIGLNPLPGAYRGRARAARARRRPAILLRRRAARAGADGARTMVDGGARRRPAPDSRSTRSSSATARTSRRATRSRSASASERQSSSGLIVATGTGATGWAAEHPPRASLRARAAAPEDGAWPSSCARRGRAWPPGRP